ncbi:MAG: transglutaminase domain-containing protein [Planctomycetota bacterium]|nr:MAG: transglutaminase domain-containing protein [Planctomycetota bacterium]
MTQVDGRACWVLPGSADPLPDVFPAALAEHYGVSLDQVIAWCDAGLAQERDGRLNPFTVCNWLSQGRLHLAPALARRWRSYLQWFRPFVQGRDEQRVYRWQRQHRCFFSVPPVQWHWWLPLVPNTAYQYCLEDRLERAQRCRVGGVSVWRLQGTAEEALDVQGHCSVRVESVRALPPDNAEYQSLYAIAEEFVSTFTYGYRRHRRHAHGLECSEDGSGSCLDAALILAQRYRSAGRPATIVGGIIANDALANPHFWVEVGTCHGPTVVDPSIPAIAKMLGEDWQAWLAAYVGGMDARRITLARGMSPLPGVLPHTFNWSIGEVMVQDAAGSWRNAWPCIDWVCGECQGIFNAQIVESQGSA